MRGQCLAHRSGGNALTRGLGPACKMPDEKPIHTNSMTTIYPSYAILLSSICLYLGRFCLPRRTAAGLNTQPELFAGGILVFSPRLHSPALSCPWHHCRSDSILGCWPEPLQVTDQGLEPGMDL